MKLGENALISLLSGSFILVSIREVLSSPNPFSVGGISRDIVTYLKVERLKSFRGGIVICYKTCSGPRHRFGVLVAIQLHMRWLDYSQSVNPTDTRNPKKIEIKKFLCLHQINYYKEASISFHGCFEIYKLYSFDSSKVHIWKMLSLQIYNYLF